MNSYNSAIMFWLVILAIFGSIGGLLYWLFLSVSFVVFALVTLTVVSLIGGVFYLFLSSINVG